MANASLDDSHQASTYRRIELITGEAKRRRWTAEEKARIVAESLQPGATVSIVALRHGVNRGLLWTWRRNARKRLTRDGQRFVPVRIVGEMTAPTMPTMVGRNEDIASPTATQMAPTSAEPIVGTIDVEIGGARVRVSGAVDAAALRQVLTHLGRKA
ncbi:MAG: transposase [Alphaproteobacteria bacterium]|nr:transposase [Alphaproteobacteria bacterium]